MPKGPLVWSCPSCSWRNPGIRCQNCNRKHGAARANVSMIVEPASNNGHRKGQYKHRQGNKPTANIQTHPDGTAWA